MKTKNVCDWVLIKLQKLGSRLTPALGCSTFYNQNIICENVIALAYWEENTF